MTAKEAIQQIKALFADANGQDGPSANPTEQFKDYQLADGSTVMIDNLAVGGLVTVQGPEGPIPAPAGDHVLADGQVIKLDESGKILEIMVPEIEVEKEVEINPEMEMMKSKIEQMAKDMEDLKKQFSNDLEANKSAFRDELKIHSDRVVALKNVLEEFFNSAPSADPLKPEKFHTSKEQKIERFLQFTKSI